MARKVLFSLFLLWAAGHFCPILANTTITNTDPCNCNLPKPKNLHYVRISTTTTHLAWDTVANADAYKLKVYLNPNNPVLVYETTVTSTSATVTGLTPGAEYRYTVAAMCQCYSELEESWQVSPDYAYMDAINLIVEIDINRVPLNPHAVVIDNHSDDNCYAASHEWGNQFWIKITQTEYPYLFSIHPIRIESHIVIGKSTEESNLPALEYGRKSNDPQYYDAPCSAGIEYAVIAILGNPPSAILEITVYKDPLSFCVENVASDDYVFEVMAPTLGFSPHGSGDRNTSPKTSNTSFYAASPFIEALEVFFSSPSDQPVKLQLLDLNGCLKITQHHNTGQDSYSLPTTDLAPGLYILRVESGNEIQTFKVVKTQN